MAQFHTIMDCFATIPSTAAAPVVLQPKCSNTVIQKVEKEIQECKDEDFEAVSEKLEETRTELENLLAYQAQGAFVRARTKMQVEGEKPSKLFCSLERHNAVQKYIPKLNVQRNGIDSVISDQQEIQQETYKYYSELFKNRDQEILGGEIESFLGEDIVRHTPKVTESQKSAMEGEITLEELSKYLNKTKNNTSPGSSGFPYEFFKFF